MLQVIAELRRQRGSRDHGSKLPDAPDIRGLASLVTSCSRRSNAQTSEVVTPSPELLAQRCSHRRGDRTADQVDLGNKVVWITDSKTPNGVAEVPLMDLAVEAIRDQMQLAGNSPYLLPRENSVGHQTTFKTAWRATLRRAKVPYFRLYDLRSTYATRLSAGGVADEWVTELLCQGDAKVFKKYSQMKLQMKREALQQLNRTVNESAGVLGQAG